MFSGLGISLLINLCFSCCEADGNSRERNAKHSKGRTGGSARGEKELSGKRKEALKALNTVQNNEILEKIETHWQQLLCSHALQTIEYSLRLMPEFMNASQQIPLIGNL